LLLPFFCRRSVFLQFKVYRGNRHATDARHLALQHAAQRDHLPHPHRAGDLDPHHARLVANHRACSAIAGPQATVHAAASRSSSRMPPRLDLKLPRNNSLIASMLPCLGASSACVPIASSFWPERSRRPESPYFSRSAITYYSVKSLLLLHRNPVDDSAGDGKRTRASRAELIQDQIGREPHRQFFDRFMSTLPPSAKIGAVWLA